VKIYLFIITAVICIVAIYLVFATVRLIINSRMIEFETMKLVGAKLSTIKIPVMLNGLIAGLLSGLFAFLAFTFFQEQVKSFETLLRILTGNFLEYLIIIFLTGPFLVLLVSIFTLRKVSLKI
jgi:cell division transport system permease protein